MEALTASLVSVTDIVSCSQPSAIAMLVPTATVSRVPTRLPEAAPEAAVRPAAVAVCREPILDSHSVLLDADCNRCSGRGGRFPREKDDRHNKGLPGYA